MVFGEETAERDDGPSAPAVRSLRAARASPSAGSPSVLTNSVLLHCSRVNSPKLPAAKTPSYRTGRLCAQCGWLTLTHRRGWAHRRVLLSPGSCTTAAGRSPWRGFRRGHRGCADPLGDGFGAPRARFPVSEGRASMTSLRGRVASLSQRSHSHTLPGSRREDRPRLPMGSSPVRTAGRRTFMCRTAGPSWGDRNKKAQPLSLKDCHP